MFEFHSFVYDIEVGVVKVMIHFFTHSVFNEIVSTLNYQHNIAIGVINEELITNTAEGTIVA